MLDFETTFLYRARRYSVNGRWFTWYEACPVIKHTPKRIVVVSQNFPESPLYAGGEFSLDRAALLAEGKAYHSRHGEYFFLTKPEQGDLFPSKDVTSTVPAIEMELAAMGWDLMNLDDSQLRAYIYAIQKNINLDQAYAYIRAEE